MKNLICIASISFMLAFFHQSYTAAYHVEPILSPFTEFLYSYDKGLGSLLSNACDCSKVKSCSCSLQLGRVNLRALISLLPEKENAPSPNYVLESVLLLGDYKIYEEKTKINELEKRCSIFEDKDSYVVNKEYCIKYRTEIGQDRTQVCADLFIKERNKPYLDVQILCVRSDSSIPGTS